MAKKLKDYNNTIRFKLPSGQYSPYLYNGDVAQQWFNQNYGQGYKVTEQASEPVYSGRTLPEVEVSANAPADYDDLQDIRKQIISGNYYGHKFTPTAQNVAHYLNLLKSDRQVHNATDNSEWAKFAAGNAVAAGGAAVPFASMSLPAAIGTTAGGLVGGIAGEKAGQFLHHQFVDPNTSIGEYTAKLWNQNRPSVLGHKLPSIDASTGELANAGTWIGGALGGMSTPARQYLNNVKNRYRYVHNRYATPEQLSKVFYPQYTKVKLYTKDGVTLYSFDEGYPATLNILGTHMDNARNLRKLSEMLPPDTQLAQNYSAQSLDNYLKTTSLPIRLKYYLIGKTPKISKKDIDGYSTSINPTMQKAVKRSRGRIEPSATTQITNTNILGLNKKDIEKAVTQQSGKDFTDLLETPFKLWEPEHVEAFNQVYGDANLMHVDPVTRTAPSYIFTTKGKTISQPVVDDYEWNLSTPITYPLVKSNLQE